MSSSARPRTASPRIARANALATATLLLAAGLATACTPDGGNSPAAPPAKATATVTGATGTTAAGHTAAPAAGTTTIGRTLYAGGLRFDVKTAATTPATDTTGGKLVLTTTVTNTFRTTPVNDWPTISVDVNGTPLSGDHGTAVPPTPGASNTLPITFTTPAGFTLDGASLVLGDPGQNQAVLPLGTGGRAAADLKPLDLALPAAHTVTGGRLALSLKSAQLRADTANSPLKLGERALYLTYDMTGTVGPAGMAVSGDSLRLRLPGGQEVGPSSAPIEAIYPDRPTRQNQAAWFVFSGATDGDYTLTVTDPDHNGTPATAVFHVTGVTAAGPVG
ncbi:hypothetical protein [Streptomyces sp. NRRL B-24484]|uniref:hypothetical protein n=1 Tax=Streptomyces sp. NRRL B-24484 TaxID=1463833 RepID=UPI0004C22B22|nr:hypothetical protein [Streptomyces sp. NRRL B-24484]